MRYVAANNKDFYLYQEGKVVYYSKIKKVKVKKSPEANLGKVTASYCGTFTNTRVNTDAIIAARVGLSEQYIQGHWWSEQD